MGVLKSQFHKQCMQLMIIVLSLQVYNNHLVDIEEMNGL